MLNRRRLLEGLAAGTVAAATGALWRPRSARADSPGAAVLGVHEKTGAPDHGRDPREVQEYFGPACLSGRAFVSGVLRGPRDLRPAFQRLFARYEGAGYTRVYLSVKTDVWETKRGKWDQHFRDLGAWMGSGRGGQGRVRLIWWHEPEDDLTPYQFYTAFNRVREQVKHGWSDGRVCYAAMTYQWRPGSDTTQWSGWTKAEADEYCADVYSGRSFPLTDILPEHPGFARWHDTIVAPRDVWYTVTERGFEASRSQFERRNDTIERELEWLKTSALGRTCRGYIYWNSSGTETSGQLRLDPSGERALRRAIRDYAT